MANLIKRFAREEEGATMVEYGVMVALIAVVCIAVIAVIGTNMDLAFSNLNDELVESGDGYTATP